MELRHLRYFVTIAEEESVTRAAARLNVSQPPLSRQIRDLERELGVSLFDRNSQGVRLTMAGEIFLAEARGILERVEHAASSVKTVERGTRGKVRIGHAPSAVEILSRALRSFSRTHPLVGVELQDLGMGMLHRLRDGTLDIALTAAVSPTDLEGLVIEKLAAYPMRVAMSRDHRLSRRREVLLQDIAREPFVVRNRKEYPYHYLGTLKILEPYTRSPNVVEDHNSFESVIAAVEAGRGISIIGQMTSHIAGKRLVLRPLKPAPPLVQVVAAYRPGGLTDAAAAFLAATRAARPKQSRSRPILTT